MNSVEWSDGMERWSGVLDWITGVTRPQIPNLLDLLSAMSTKSIHNAV